MDKHVEVWDQCVVVMTISSCMMLLYSKLMQIEFTMHNIFRITTLIESFVFSKIHSDKLTPSQGMFPDSRGVIIGVELGFYQLQWVVFIQVSTLNFGNGPCPPGLVPFLIISSSLLHGRPPQGFGNWFGFTHVIFSK